MTVPMRVGGEDPLAALKALKPPARDPLEELKALHDPKPDMAAQMHAEFASGRLGKRMARENANEQEQTAVENTPGKTRAALASMAQGIPGMEAVQAGARSLIRRQPYGESLKDIRGAVETLPTGLAAGERLAGSLPLMTMLPGSPAVSGAILGGADQALAADDESLTARAMKTAGGAAVGGILGKVLDVGITGARALMAKSPAKNILGRQAERAASAGGLYSRALNEGEGKEATATVQAFLAEPEIAARVEALQRLDSFKDVPADSPQMLDALYKALTDESKSISKGLAVLDPSKPNIGRFRGENVRGLKDRLLGAMEAKGTKTVTQEVPAIGTAQSPRPSLREALGNFQDRASEAWRRKTGTVAQQTAREGLERHGAESVVSPPLRGAPPGPRTISSTVETPAVMPSYRMAAEDYATRSRDIDAVGKGITASQKTAATTRPTYKQIMSKEPKTPETFAEWVKQASPSEIAAAKEGVLGDVGNAFRSRNSGLIGPLTQREGRRAATNAGPLLRTLDPNDSGSILAKLLLGGASSIP